VKGTAGKYSTRIGQLCSFIFVLDYMHKRGRKRLDEWREQY
jgi:hypothetical protein